jgi:uncharacterized protein (DUF1015 family)
LLDAPDGVRHTLWKVDDPASVREWSLALGDIPRTYIADGHHRAASAARVAVALRDSRGSGPWDGFLTVLFPASRLRVLEYDRVVRGAGGCEAAELCDRIREAGFEVVEDRNARRPGQPGSFGMFLGDGSWRLLRPKAPSSTSDPVASLDVTVLTNRILEPIFGVDDPRTDPRMEFVGGAGAADEIERRVGAHPDWVGFSLHPTRIEDVLRVADADGIMPPKSTWFEPKARSGMVVLDFETPKP